ncbi:MULTISPECIES: hypothetical protein [Pseudomonas]|nr:hypothetical protein [Pseudomonas parafulva]
MKGPYVAALLSLALSTACQAAVEAPMQGTIRFTGAVIGSQCTLSTHAGAGLSESCPLNAVSRTLSVQPLLGAVTSPVRVRSMTPVQTSGQGEHTYVLEDAAGHLITQGRYLVTQTVL